MQRLDGVRSATSPRSVTSVRSVFSVCSVKTEITLKQKDLLRTITDRVRTCSPGAHGHHARIFLITKIKITSNFAFSSLFEKHASQSRRKSPQLVDNTHDGANWEGHPPALRRTVASAASAGRTESEGKNAENKGLSVWSQICSPSTLGTIWGVGASGRGVVAPKAASRSPTNTWRTRNIPSP